MPARHGFRPTSPWRKSSYSSNASGGECVEVCCGTRSVLVRDSHDQAGVMLSFEPGQWSLLLGRIRAVS